jgi:alanine racemase
MFLKSFFINFLKSLEDKNYQPFNLIEINQNHILDNFDLVQKLNPAHQIWPVLKSNAYGHGYTQIAQILKARNFQYLIVDSYHEALIIRKVSNQPILLIGALHPSNFNHLKVNKLTLCIQNFQTLKALCQTKRKTKIHIKINTGMNRQGIQPEEIEKFTHLLKQNPQIELEGLFSHLADADNPNNSYTQKQASLFQNAIKLFSQSGFHPRFTHLAASAGCVKIPPKLTNAIRIGKAIYGYPPLPPQDNLSHKFNQLKPALRLTSTVTKLRQIKKGNSVSYNLTWTANQNTQIGVIPIGYYDGVDRRLSNCGFIKYKNHTLPIIGRICMNLTLIDFKNTNPKLFDQVEIISPNPSDKNSIVNIAKTCNTISYDILVRLHESIRRIIINKF